MKKYSLMVFLVSSMMVLVFLLSSPSEAITKISIQTKNNPWDNNPQTIASGETENGRVFVPMRLLFETYDATVDWQPSTKTIMAERCDGAILKMSLGSKIVSITQNNKTTNITMDVVPKVKFGKTIVPLRFVAENLLCDVQWVEKERKVIIIKEYLTSTIDKNQYTINLKTEDYYSKSGDNNFELIGKIRGIKNYFTTISNNYSSNIMKVEKTTNGNHIININIDIFDSSMYRQLKAYINAKHQSSQLAITKHEYNGSVDYYYYINNNNIWLPEEDQVLKIDDVAGEIVNIYNYKDNLEKCLATNPFVDINEIDRIGFNFCDDTNMLLCFTKKSTFNTVYFVLINLKTNQSTDLIAKLIPAEEIKYFIRKDHVSPYYYLQFLNADTNKLYFNYVKYNELSQPLLNPIAYQYQ
ncbi:MAG: copper amine oxidase N-terminal domain-containing protein [Desulfitobacteriaceae bacterium]|nr:copper amine oxidase N-terminal domain-containing protein [Desulfitobacteriaceae bacterium]